MPQLPAAEGPRTKQDITWPYHVYATAVAAECFYTPHRPNKKIRSSNSFLAVVMFLVSVFDWALPWDGFFKTIRPWG